MGRAMPSFRLASVKTFTKKVLWVCDTMNSYYDKRN